MKTKSKSEKIESIKNFERKNNNSGNICDVLTEYKSNGDVNNKNEHLKFDINKPKFIEIDEFQIEFMNFADDCCLAMKPMIKKCKLTNIIKYNYRLNLQSSITNFFSWTRFYQLVLAKGKCSTATFTRKKFFHAYVYKLDDQKLELIHSNINGPQRCKHNEKLQYVNPLEELSEGNGDSDLENLDIHGNKIKLSGNLSSTNPRHNMFKLDKKGKGGKRQRNAIYKLQIA